MYHRNRYDKKSHILDLTFDLHPVIVFFSFSNLAIFEMTQCLASYFMYSDVAEKKVKHYPTPAGILLLTALHWKSRRRFTDKLANSLLLDY